MEHDQKLIRPGESNNEFTQQIISCHFFWRRYWYCKSRWVSLVKAERTLVGCWHWSLCSLQEPPVETGNQVVEWRGGQSYSKEACMVQVLQCPEGHGKHAVWLSKSEAEKEGFATISPDGDDVFRIAKQMDHRNQDIVGENCVHNDADKLALTGKDKMKAWVEHYARLLNDEFECGQATSSLKSPTIALFLVEVPLMPSSFFASCRRSTLQLRNYSTLPSSTLRKPPILCQGRSYDGHLGASGWGMGCACHPGHVLQCLESCAGQWSVQWGVWHGSWCISGVISKLKVWKSGMESKGLHINMKKPSAWSLVMPMMSSRNLASTPVLSAVVVSTETPSCAHSECCGSTRRTVS